MNVTAETMALMKAALKSGTTDQLAKAITTSTGLTYYDLQAPAKNLYPTITKLRNMTPRVGRPSGYGTQANWKVVSGLTGSGFDAMGWIPEGQRSGAMSYTTANASAAYVTLGEEDYLTFEAESAGEGFEDVNATLSMRLLQKTMRKEENGLLAGNGTGTGGIALGTPGTPTLSTVADTTSLLQTQTQSVIVVALTAEGYLNCKGNAAAGFTPSKTITGMDGQQFTLNGGNSTKSTNATQATTSGTNGLFASVAPVLGAVAYAWFVGLAGSETLQQITTVNVAYFNTLLATGRQAISTVSADNSQNAIAFSGYLSNAFSGGTVQTLATAASTGKGVGTPLTSSGRGSVVEIDTLLKSMWDNYRLGPNVIWVSSQEQQNITSKVLNGSSSPLLRYTVDGTGNGGYDLTANGQIKYYYNPFTGGGQADEAGDKIAIIAHPDLPPGTLFAHCAQLPMWYQSNEVPNTAEVITRRDYYRTDWPLRTRRREYGIYAEEVLAVYAQFALGILTNIGNG